MTEASTPTSTLTPAPTKPVDKPIDKPVKKDVPSSDTPKEGAPAVPSVVLSATPAPTSKPAVKPVDNGQSSEASPVVMHDHLKNNVSDDPKLREYRLTGAKHMHYRKGDIVKLSDAQFHAFRDKFEELDEDKDDLDDKASSKSA